MSEHFVSGYCRQLDGARMVELEVVDRELTDCDCDFGNCPFQTVCKIAESIEEYLK